MTAFIAAVPALLAAGLIAMLRAAPWSMQLADHPNDRSLHREPRPRIGGIGVWVAVAATVPFIGPGVPWIALSGAAILFLVSLTDDLRGLAIEARLAAHFGAAVLVVATGASFDDARSAAWAAVAVVAIVWMTNLFNFMDGSDGLCAGMAIVGFATLAWAAGDAGANAIALTCLAIAAASAGFLVHNFPPARVFLGDAGSIPLGFLAGAIGFLGTERDLWPAWFPVLVFSPFIVDASTTLARRIVRREPFWRAHRSHYYQRLVLAGLPQRRLALSGYAVMVAAAASAVAALHSGPGVQLGILTGWAMACVSLLVAIDRRARRADGATHTPGRSAG